MCKIGYLMCNFYYLRDIYIFLSIIKCSLVVKLSIIIKFLFLGCLLNNYYKIILYYLVLFDKLLLFYFIEVKISIIFGINIII